MTVDLHTPTTKEKKEKKSKKPKEKRNGEDAGGGVYVRASHCYPTVLKAGTTDEVTAEKKSKKDKKKKKDKAAEDGMAVDPPADPTDDPIEEKKSKKKRKREAAEEDVAEDAGSSKKEKKKRKKEVESTPSDDAAAEPSTSESKQPREKKDKKDKKSKKDKKAKDAPSDPSPSGSVTPPAPSSSSDVEAFLQKNEITLTIPDGGAVVTPILSFSQLDVHPKLRAAFDGFKEPTPIQACSWPPSLEGRDVVGIAETGSGKTLAFGLPLLARLLASPLDKKAKGTTVSALVMAPTRELAIQTHETLEKLGEPFGIASVAVYGGVDKGPQIKALKNMNKGGMTTRIVVGTPGRILDLANEGACDLSRVSYLVLDEADRMLDKGFENDIRNIIGRTVGGSERQTLMFSATWPDAVRRLAATFQRDPVRVTVGSDDLTANSRVEQVVEVFDEPREKDSRLLGHLRTLIPRKPKGSEAETRILVFALYKKEAQRVEGMLKSKGFSVGGLHGDMSQSARLEALQNFKTGTTGLLVATDVAARGLDIPNVAAVINYTFPLTIEDYIHRIGRTGRGGKSGKSITFFTGEAHERALAGELARVLRESGFEAEGLRKFPMTIKKKTHSAYGAFFRDDIPTPKAPTKITF
uniref:RNA helicase n=1 Tax=Ganoderma boninense TaxID=34458 RepID=A0A5K1JSZ8_9APHY|nr:ATP-dependent RNA helicase CshA (EC [Ganoderma boninense]